MFVPVGLKRSVATWWRDAGRAWLEGLPALVAEFEERWSITVGRAFEPGGVTAFVAPAVRADGSPAVLKIAYPHREVLAEAAALALHDGDGAVRLLASDPDRLVMLLERCDPGSALGDVAAGDKEEMFSVSAALLRRLWKPVPPDHPFESLAAVAANWTALIKARWTQFDRPFDVSLLDTAVDLLSSLPASATEDVLLHQDFHPWNVLAAQREPWLAIDPKPMVGDPAFDLVQLSLHGHPLDRPDAEAVVGGRIEWLAAQLGVDAERIRLWGLARMVEWALWSLAVDDDSEGQAIEEAKLFARLG